MHVVLHLARIAWLASEYGLIASLLIAAVAATGTGLRNLLARLVNKARCRRSERDPASAQLILS